MALYELAFMLRIPLYQLKSEMPFEELRGWEAYFDRRPPGWQDDLRAYYLMQIQGDKRRPGEIFESLRKLHAGSAPDPKNHLPSLKNSFIFQQMMNAKGGDKLEF